MTAATYRTREKAWQGQDLFDWDSQGLATGGIIRAAPGCIVEAFGMNNSGSTRYLMFFDSTTVPADATVPKLCPVVVPAGAPFSITFNEGLAFGTGISWASSSTLATKTITGLADIWLTAVVR